MAYYPEPVARLIEALQRLPGIGPKTAQRLTFFLLKRPVDEVRELSDALVAVKERIVVLPHAASTSPTRIPAASAPTRAATPRCSASSRSPTTCWRWSAPASSAAATTCCSARSRRSTASAPTTSRCASCSRAWRPAAIDEVILATNPNVEGEATALYLAKLLRPLGVRLTRIARGLPVGGDLEYADQVTLSKALEGRREVS